MNFDPVKNFATTTLVSGINDSVTNMIVTDASVFPNPNTEGAFNVVIWDTYEKAVIFDTNREIVRCTALSGNTFTIIRGQEGTTATNHNTAGHIYNVDLCFTSSMYNTFASGINLALSGAGNTSNSADVCLIWSHLGT